MIDESLKDKINANDQKIKSLFKIKKKSKDNNNKNTKYINHPKKNSKISILSKHNTTNIYLPKEQKNYSFLNNKENQKNLINLDLNPKLTENTIKNITLNNDSLHSITKSSAKNYLFQQNYKPKIKMKYKELECFINKKQSNKSIQKKIKKKSKSVNKNIETNNRNIQTSQSNLTKIKCSTSANIPLRKKFCKSFDFNLTYERFIENETKKNEKLKKIKKRREKFENRIHPHQPRINQKSKSLTKSITDDFLVRLEKYKKEQIEKEEILKNNILKDEEDKINKHNYMFIHKKLKKRGLNDSVDKIYNDKIITESVNKLLDWDKKRKEKIEKKIKKLEIIEKFSHIPKINKSKNSNNKDKIIKRIFDRLYDKNKYIFEFKKELLTQESTPKFQSLLNKAKSQSNVSFSLNNIIPSITEKCNKNEDDEKSFNYQDTNITNNEEEIKIENNTDRTMFNKKINNKEDNSIPQKRKNLIVVIRKIKSHIDNANHNKFK